MHPISKGMVQRWNATTAQIHYPLRDGDLAGRIYMWRGAIPMPKENTFNWGRTVNLRDLLTTIPKARR